MKKNVLIFIMCMVVILISGCAPTILSGNEPYVNNNDVNNNANEVVQAQETEKEYSKLVVTIKENLESYTRKFDIEEMDSVYVGSGVCYVTYQVVDDNIAGIVVDGSGTLKMYDHYNNAIMIVTEYEIEVKE